MPASKAELEHRRQRPPRRRLPKARRCLGCLAALENGALVCSEECDQLAWRIVPTISGELLGKGLGATVAPRFFGTQRRSLPRTNCHVLMK